MIKLSDKYVIFSCFVESWVDKNVSNRKKLAKLDFVATNEE
jgi:hypothetical protein